MKLYKFRALETGHGDCKEDGTDDFTRAKEILTTDKFYSSKFWELNDPMEGVFSILGSPGVKEKIKLIYSRKNKYRICSFSGKGLNTTLGDDLFKNPLMWGYYANGFKGMAIEIDVSQEYIEQKYVTPIKYLPYNKFTNLKDDPAEDDIKDLLTTKLNAWEHESEWRFLWHMDRLEEKKSEYEKGSCKIGEITKIYFGDPYGNIKNCDQVFKDNKNIRKYHRLRNELKQIAEKQNPPISCSYVEVINGKVEPKAIPPEGE